MEMIMKAFEALERKQQRRKESVTETRDEKPVGSGLGGGGGGPNRRRRSSSYKLTGNTDSNLDEMSSADESKPEPKRAKRKGRKVGSPTTPQRRRSRIMSGGTASALSTDEDHNLTNSQDAASTPGGPTGGPFRFPKTKKSLMTDWLQESSDVVAAQNDDDVSANYLRGSRSPPGIATHLLRSNAPMSPVKNVCSAKKRWLRQAISEDHTDETPVNGNASPSGSDACFGDYVTPLKKRRLASYKDDQDHQSSGSPVDPKWSPNGLKNKLLSNLVLEAVLDRALEDMAGTSGIARSVSVDSAADSSASLRSPDDSPMKEPVQYTDEGSILQGESTDESPATDKRNDFDDNEEEFATRHEDNEDEQVEVEETSSNTGDDEISRDVVEEHPQEGVHEETFDDDVEEDVRVDIEEEEQELGVDAEVPSSDDVHQEPDEVEDDDDKEQEPELEEVVKEEFHPHEDDNAQQEPPTPEAVNQEMEHQMEDAPQSGKTEVSVTPIKTPVPEPSLVFKSFFTSNVSIEELEAEIEASKKARMEDDLKIPVPESLEMSTTPPTTSTATLLPIDLPTCDFSLTPTVLTETTEQFSRTSIERRDSEASTATNDSCVVTKTTSENHSDDSNNSVAKPKEKKRFSLADYKKRRQTEGPPAANDASRHDEGPGTPTLDEELASFAAPPTLNTLPLFEKLDKLEKAQKEGKKKGNLAYF